MSLIGYAITALQQGMHVFPVQPGEKTPHKLRPDRDYTIRWSEEVTNDLNRVIEIWSWSPMANIGVAAKQSGLLVIDCDLPKAPNQLAGTPYESLHDKWGPLVDGMDVLKEICERYGGDWSALTDTYTVCTTRKGAHLYLRWPAGLQASQASPVKGLVDVRGNGGVHGGYVLGAGSRTASGPYVAENASPIRDAPPWLVELCRERPPPARPTPLFAQPRRGGSIGGLVDTVRDAVPGNRSNALYWSARAACSDGIPIEEAIDQLGAAYTGRGGQRQAEASVRSAYRNQSRKEGL
ncbi:bifunctional DNA primase/polymerase [Streptomyces atriruber]|uniref:bifunctional DNA primase/polymerase n=1 Tax=Streptomyces atriruber TaxID=545121 RepID=UPI000AE018C3|nr:bifunctional DNA primase/polymerase [Streptomyces atriruber]